MISKDDRTRNIVVSWNRVIKRVTFKFYRYLIHERVTSPSVSESLLHLYNAWNEKPKRVWWTLLSQG